MKSKRNPHYPRIRLMTLICLLLSLMATTTASASSSTSFASVGPVSSDLTTPALIEQAFRNNQITADQRLLYLTYAVYDFAKLPPQFQGKGGWRGTMIVYEINQARQQLREGKGQFSPALREALLAPQPQASTFCEAQDGPYTISTEHFEISYGSITALSVQDYADALELAYQVEIEEFGWAVPPLAPNNPFKRYPVQIAELSYPLLGRAVSPAGKYTGFLGDNPNTPEVETSSLASCIVLNSDFTKSFIGVDHNQLRQAVIATAAHEFFHIIQFGLGDPNPYEGAKWYEATAAYVENEVIPEAHGNYSYLFPDLSYSVFSPQVGSDYSLWPLFRYAAERNGGLGQANGGSELMKLMWKDIAAGIPAFTAYENALKAKGSSFDHIYHNFAISLRFLKSCTDAETFCFYDANTIRNVRGMVNTVHGQIASVGGSYNGSMSNNYATNWVALPKSGAYSIELTNTSSTGALRASVLAEVGDSLTVALLSSVAGPNATASIARFSVPSGATNVLLVITNEAQSSNINSPGAATYRVQLGTAADLDHLLYVPLSLR